MRFKLKYLRNLSLSIITSFLITSCSMDYQKIRENFVLIESNPYLKVDQNKKMVDDNFQVSFLLSIPKNAQILSINFNNYHLNTLNNPKDDNQFLKLDLFDVFYDLYLVIDVKYYHQQIEYDLNGGYNINTNSKENITQNVDNIHFQTNTIIANEIRKENHTLIGLENEFIFSSLGGRIKYSDNLKLKLVYRENSPQSLFSYKVTNNSAQITNYYGSEESLVIPEFIDEFKVTKIMANSFKNLVLKELILPPSIIEIEDNAFINLIVDNLYFFDTLKIVNDLSFSATKFKKIHLNTATKPVFSGTYFDTFTDKMDRLILNKDKPQIVFGGGSAQRFGLDSKLINQNFKDYQVSNLGVFAYANMKTQYDTIFNYLKSGDTLVIAPEFDAIKEQISFSTSFPVDYFKMIEGNYNLLTDLPIEEYTHFFLAYQEYKTLKDSLVPKDYSVFAYFFDEDNNFLGERTYNDYGDYIVDRPNNIEEKVFGIKRASYNKDDFPLSYLVNFNTYFQKFIDKGIKLYFDYAPRSKISLTPSSNAQSIKELDLYLRENLLIPFVTSIDDSLLSPLYFYNTDNHLSTEGVKIRTEKLIKNLKVYL